MGSRSRDRVAAIRHLVAARLPDHEVHSVVQVGEGSDHLAYEVNGELIVRCSKEPDPAARAGHVDREARLLAAVAAIAPLPVPAPSLVIPEQGCLAYRKLRGVPLLDLPRQQRSAHDTTIAAMLGELLTALHARPWSRWPRWWASTTSRSFSGRARPPRPMRRSPGRCRWCTADQ